MMLIYHPGMSHHPDDTKFKYSKTLNNILNHPIKCVHTGGINDSINISLVIA